MMNLDQPDHRPISAPLFHAIPSGTYTYRYRDAKTDTRTEAPSSNLTNSLQGEELTAKIVDEIKTPEHSAQPCLSITSRLEELDEPSTEGEKRISETTDPILYRETTAVSNGSMTLLSKQVGVEAPQTGAKGRAREREARRFAAARIMPSQGLVDAAKGLSRREGSGRTVSYPPLTAERYLVGEVMEEREGRVARARNPDEMLMVGCGADYDRRSRERGRAPASSFPSQPSNSCPEPGFVIDNKWLTSGTEAQRLPAPHPVGEFSRPNPEREKRQRERSRLLDENARLRKEVSRLEEMASTRREEEMLRDENARLKEELRKLREDAVYDDEVEGVYERDGRNGMDSFVHEDLWKDAGMGNQPRRSANRGNRVGASLMSQEVMVEHPSAGKGRAREREEKRRLQNLAHTPSRSDSDPDERERRRRTNWRTRVFTDSEDDEHREPMTPRDAARAAALTNLPPHVLAKYGPDRPPRIWREHSHEILVEAANGGGSKRRRREVNEKRERENEVGEVERGAPRFRPPTGLVQATKSGVLHRTKNEDGSVTFDWDPEKFEAWRRGTMVEESQDPDSGDEEESRRDRSPDEALAKYAADRPSRMFRDGSCEVLLEGDVAGRRRRVERAYRHQLPEPRFMPSQAMANAAAKMDRGKNAFLDDDEDKDGDNRRDENDSADDQ